jgi:hypothetical protein
MLARSSAVVRAGISTLQGQRPLPVSAPARFDPQADFPGGGARRSASTSSGSCRARGRSRSRRPTATGSSWASSSRGSSGWMSAKIQSQPQSFQVKSEGEGRAQGREAQGQGFRNNRQEGMKLARALVRPVWRWGTVQAVGSSALRLQPMPRVRGPALLPGSVRRFSAESLVEGEVSGEVLDGAVRAIEHGGEQAMGRFVRGLSPAAQEALQNYLSKQSTEVREPKEGGDPWTEGGGGLGLFGQRGKG